MKTFGIQVCFCYLRNLRDPLNFCLNFAVRIGVMFIRHGYLRVYTSDFYKLEISLERRYMSIRWCKEHANIRICYMIFFNRKNCGVLEILVLIMRDACGVVLIRLEYHTNCTSDFFFINLVSA